MIRRCKYARQYQAFRRPTCGCQSCARRWKEAVRKRIFVSSDIPGRYFLHHNVAPHTFAMTVLDYRLARDLCRFLRERAIHGQVFP